MARPSFEVVDTVLPLAAAITAYELKQQKAPAYLLANLKAGANSNPRHFQNTAAVMGLAVRCGGEYRIEADPSLAIDASPGSNTFIAYPELSTPAEEKALLAEYGARVNIPNSISAEDFLAGGGALDCPVVIKDTHINRGEGKMLIDDPTKLEVLRNYLGSKTFPDNQFGLDGIIIEQYIKGPHDHAANFRITTTADGGVVATNLKYSLQPVGGTLVTAEACGNRLRSLGNPNSRYFIEPKSVTSNFFSETDVDTIPLSFSSAGVSGFTARNQLEADVLEMHNIDPNNPELPLKVENAAVDTARILGPRLGLLVGVDIMLNASGSPYYLEVNNSPSLNNTRLSLGGPEGFWTDGRIYLTALRQMFVRLSTGES